MGMYCTLRRVNETDLRRLRKEPEQVYKFLYGEPVELEEVREPGLVAFIMRLFGEKTYQAKKLTAAEEEVANRELEEIQRWTSPCAARDYLFGAFEDLRAFITATAKTGDSVIISIS